MCDVLFPKKENAQGFSCNNGSITCDSVADLGQTVIIENPRLVVGGETVLLLRSRWYDNVEYFNRFSGNLFCRWIGFRDGIVTEPQLAQKFLHKKKVAELKEERGVIHVHSVSNNYEWGIQTVTCTK